MNDEQTTKKRTSEWKVQITTTISPENKKWLDENHRKACDILAFGIQATKEKAKMKEENANLVIEITKINERMNRLHEKIYEFSNTILRQQDEIDDLKVKK